MNFGYIRVSSDKQTVENQRFEIAKFCKSGNIEIDGWIEETVSGTRNYEKRQLGKLLRRVRKDDLIICAEISRLGRNLFMIKEALARKKAEGVPLGCPLGSRTAPERRKLYAKREMIERLLAKGVSKTEIARRCRVCRNTVAKYAKEQGT